MPYYDVVIFPVSCAMVTYFTVPDFDILNLSCPFEIFKVSVPPLSESLISAIESFNAPLPESKCTVSDCPTLKVL
jgi:hypothetical protein